VNTVKLREVVQVLSDNTKWEQLYVIVNFIPMEATTGTHRINVTIE